MSKSFVVAKHDVLCQVEINPEFEDFFSVEPGCDGVFLIKRKDKNGVFGVPIIIVSMGIRTYKYSFVEEGVDDGKNN